MKIMIVAPYFYPKVRVKNYALNITRGMKKNQGHEIFVVTFSHIDKQKVEEAIEGRSIT
jgi:hypothetical protein